MDIKNKFRQALAGAATLTLLASNAGVALAGTYFTDVNTGDWFEGYVNQLAVDKVVDTGPANTMFRPNEAGNRAELFKMAAEVTGLMDGFVMPATPKVKFTDVPAGAWYEKYVYALSEAGVIAGDTDSKGNALGTVRPGANMNRAEAAKVIAGAFQLTNDKAGALPFGDVKSTDWFYKSVQSVYYWTVVDGKTATKYDPSANVTRAEWSKMLVNAQDPKWREVVNPVDPCVKDPTLPECDDKPPVTSDGTLTVELSSDTPDGVTIPKNATSIPMARYDFTATGDDVWVDALTLTRTGLGDNDDFSGIYPVVMWNDQVLDIGNERSFTDDENAATLLLDMEVPRGETITIEIRGNTSDSAGVNNEHAISIMDEADVDTNAKTLDIDTPLTGETFEIGSITLDTVTMTTSGTVSNVTVGEKDAILSKFKVENNGGEDYIVTEITLENGGSVDSDDISDLSLVMNGDIVATLDGPTTGDLFTFKLDEPLTITSGNSRTFQVEGTPIGDPNIDTIRFFLAEDYHLVGMDGQYGFANPVTNEFTFLLAPVVTLEGGAVTFSNNGPISSEYSTDATRASVLDMALTFASDIEMQYLPVDFYLETPNGDSPTVTSQNSAISAVAALVGNSHLITVAADTGFSLGDAVKVTCAATDYYGYVVTELAPLATTVNVVPADGTDLDAACPGVGTLTEVNPYEGFTNLRFVDMDDDASTLDGPIDVADGTLNGDHYSIDFDTENFFTAGTYNLALLVDLDNAIAGYRFFAETNNTNADQFQLEGNQFVPVADIENGDITGNSMIVSGDSLTVTLGNQISSQTYVANQANVKVLSLNLQAGEASDVEVTELVLNVKANLGATWLSADGDLAANQVVSTVALYEGNTLVATAQNLSENSGDYFVRFENSDFVEPLLVDAGDTRALTAVVQLKNDVTARLALTMDPTTDIDAETANEDQETVIANGSVINVFNVNTYPVVMSITTGGTLTVESSGNPNAAIALSGTSKFLASKLTFKALNEGFRITKFVAYNDDVATDNSFATNEATEAVTFANVTYMDADTNQMVTKSAAFNQSGVASFTGLNIVVPKDGTINADLSVDVNTKEAAGEDISGALFRVGLKDASNNSSTFEAVGLASNDTITNPTFQNTASIKQFVVRTAKPVFTQESVGNVLGDGDVDLYKWKVKAEGGDVSFGRIVFSVDVADAAVANLAVDDFRLYRDGNPVDASDVTIHDATGDTDLSVGGAGALADGLSSVVVAFVQEESITKNDENIYTLVANVAASATDDSLKTQISTGDETTAVNTILAAGNNGNANTGQLVDTSVAIEALFAGVTAVADFSEAATVARNIIWSDKSAGANHLYNTSNDASSTDFTNGYLLKLTNLSSSTLTK